MVRRATTIDAIVMVTAHFGDLDVYTSDPSDFARPYSMHPASVMPASALQLHPDATVLLDEAAASRLALADYYRFATAHQPAWQRVD